MKPLKNITIDGKRTLNDGCFCLNGVGGETTYHVWVDKDLNVKPDTFVYANKKGSGERTRLIGLKSKLGTFLLASLIDRAKQDELMADALKENKAYLEKQKLITEARAKTIADRKLAQRHLIGVVKTMLDTRFAWDDPNDLAALRRRATEALAKIDV